LLRLGWIDQEPSDQRAENRWGRAFRINLAWEPLSTPLPSGRKINTRNRLSRPGLGFKSGQGRGRNPGRQSTPPIEDRSPRFRPRFRQTSRPPDSMTSGPRTSLRSAGCSSCTARRSIGGWSVVRRRTV
jgi:hypothetical protein